MSATRISHKQRRRMAAAIERMASRSRRTKGDERTRLLHGRRDGFLKGGRDE